MKDIKEDSIQNKEWVKKANYKISKIKIAILKFTSIMNGIKVDFDFKIKTK